MSIWFDSLMYSSCKNITIKPRVQRHRSTRSEKKTEINIWKHEIPIQKQLTDNNSKWREFKIHFLQSMRSMKIKYLLVIQATTKIFSRWNAFLEEILFKWNQNSFWIVAAESVQLKHYSFSLIVVRLNMIKHECKRHHHAPMLDTRNEKKMKQQMRQMQWQ